MRLSSAAFSSLVLYAGVILSHHAVEAGYKGRLGRGKKKSLKKKRKKKGKNEQDEANVVIGGEKLLDLDLTSRAMSLAIKEHVLTLVLMYRCRILWHRSRIHAGRNGSQS